MTTARQHRGLRVTRSPAGAAWLAWLALASPGAFAESLRGLALAEALEQLRSEGLALVYSSDLVRPGMRVEREPRASDPRERLAELLAPHGLAVEPGPGGVLLLVRAAPAPVSAPRPRPANALAEVVVSASHWRLNAEPLAAVNVMSAAELSLLPDIGEDPLRAISRLPGAARQDFSSRTHLRGGADNETLVRYDDLRLYNPFHFKDFLGVFSTVDPGIVREISVYTGGFPVSFGDRSSGVIDIEPRAAQPALSGELGASFFNTHGLIGGAFDEGAGDWLVAARRSNLEWFLGRTNSRLGDPRYHDVHARISHRLGEDWTVSANLLVFDDELRAFDSDQEEQARARYRDEYYWLRLEHAPGEDAGLRLLAADTRLSSDRAGISELPGVATGSLEDGRDFRIRSLQADGWWRGSERLLLQAGLEFRRAEGRYRYRDEVEFDVLFDLPTAPQSTTRSQAFDLRPRGQQFSAYLNSRWELADDVTADLGLRWDRDSLGSRDDHLSPRAVLLWQADDATRLRLSYGRFVQVQGINELSVPDGEVTFQPAQRADHLVASLERQLNERLALRLEAWRKDYDRVLPRYENLLNTLVVLPELKPDRIRIAPQSAEARGAELSLGWRDGPLSAWASYGWSRAWDRVDGERLPRAWDQRQQAHAGMTWHGERWDLSLAGNWHSGWPTTEIELETLEPVPFVSVGARNARRLAPFASLDLRIARRWDLGAGSELTVFLEANNLLKRGNECCVEYDIEEEDGERDFDVGVRRSLPTVPSLGFVWRF